MVKMCAKTPLPKGMKGCKDDKVIACACFEFLSINNSIYLTNSDAKLNFCNEIEWLNKNQACQIPV